METLVWPEAITSGTCAEALAQTFLTHGDCEKRPVVGEPIDVSVIGAGGRSSGWGSCLHASYQLGSAVGSHEEKKMHILTQKTE